MADWLKNEPPGAIADLGTGTGLLSLMIAQKNESAIDAVDIEWQAFLDAKKNFEKSPWSARLQLFHSDIRIFSRKIKYDFIMSNPPFYENDLLPANGAKAIAKHSRMLSLVDLLERISVLLTRNGRFAVLLPYSRASSFAADAFQYNFFLQEQSDVRQSVHHDYFRSIMLFGKQKCDCLIKEISIRADGNDYTKQFKELLKDYYLYL